MYNALYLADPISLCQVARELCHAIRIKCQSVMGFVGFLIKAYISCFLNVALYVEVTNVETCNGIRQEQVVNISFNKCSGCVIMCQCACVRVCICVLWCEYVCDVAKTGFVLGIIW